MSNALKFCFPVTDNNDEKKIVQEYFMGNNFTFSMKIFRIIIKEIIKNPEYINSIKGTHKFSAFMKFNYQVITLGIDNVKTIDGNVNTYISPIKSNNFDEKLMRPVVEETFKYLKTDEEIIKYFHYLPFFQTIIMDLVKRCGNKDLFVNLQYIKINQLCSLFGSVSIDLVCERFSRDVFSTENPQLINHYLETIFKGFKNCLRNVKFSYKSTKPRNIFSKVFKLNTKPYYVQIVKYFLIELDKYYRILKAIFEVKASKSRKWSKDLENRVFELCQIRYFCIELVESFLNSVNSFEISEVVDIFLEIKNCEIMNNIAFLNFSRNKLLEDLARILFKYTVEKYSKEFKKHYYYSLFTDLKSFGIDDIYILEIKETFEKLCKEVIIENENKLKKKIKIIVDKNEKKFDGLITKHCDQALNF